MPTALIFGGSGEIGRAICSTFAKNGYSIAFTYCNNKEQANKIEMELKKYSINPPMAIYCDVRSEKSIESVFQLPIYFDVVINCIGNALYKELTDSTIEDFDNMIVVNLRSAFILTKLAVQKMLSRSIEGSIIHLSSIWGNVGASCESLYAATKGGINAFTKSIAKELAISKIRVNAIACGMIESAMNAKFSKEEVQEFFKNAPIQKMGTAEDIATVAYFLSINKYITGEIITVDGGVTL